MISETEVRARPVWARLSGKCIFRSIAVSESVMEETLGQSFDDGRGLLDKEEQWEQEVGSVL